LGGEVARIGKGGLEARLIHQADRDGCSCIGFKNKTVVAGVRHGTQLRNGSNLNAATRA
jgi:hypothetical protein